MKKTTTITMLVVLGLLLGSGEEALAAQDAHIKCLVRPGQAQAVPIWTNWNVTIRWRVQVGSFQRAYSKDLVIPSDGFFEWPFERPARGSILQGSIRIWGGWAYQDSSLSFVWDGSSAQPELTEIKNSTVWWNGQHKDTARYGAQFNMVRK